MFQLCVTHGKWIKIAFKLWHIIVTFCHNNSHQTNIIPTLTSSQLVYNLSKQQEVKRKICQHNTIWSRDGLFNFLFAITCCFVHTDLEICSAANKTYRLAHILSATQSHTAVNGVEGKYGVRWRLLSNMAKHWNNLDGNGCYVTSVEDASSKSLSIIITNMQTFTPTAQLQV